jgi:hypothetical protein
MRLLLLCGLLAAPIFAIAAAMPPVTMTFVDAKNGQPLADVPVMFTADAKQGTITGHGGGETTLFLVEAVTDNAGQVRFKEQAFWPYPYLANTRINGTLMVAFKPGYKLVRLVHSGYRGDLADATTWPYNDKVIKMVPTEGDAAQERDAIEAATNDAQQIYQWSSQKNCAWTRIPVLIRAIDGAVKAWDQKQRSLPDPTRRRPIGASLLDQLVWNENGEVAKGCPSPKAFFN